MYNLQGCGTIKAQASERKQIATTLRPGTGLGGTGLNG
jgi:hypothetical protein